MIFYPRTLDQNKKQKQNTPRRGEGVLRGAILRTCVPTHLYCNGPHVSMREMWKRWPSVDFSPLFDHLCLCVTMTMGRSLGPQFLLFDVISEGVEDCSSLFQCWRGAVVCIWEAPSHGWLFWFMESCNGFQLHGRDPCLNSAPLKTVMRAGRQEQPAIKWSGLTWEEHPAGVDPGNEVPSALLQKRECKWPGPTEPSLLPELILCY